MEQLNSVSNSGKPELNKINVTIVSSTQICIKLNYKPMPIDRGKTTYIPKIRKIEALYSIIDLVVLKIIFKLTIVILIVI